jgi:hypothetical protein
MRARRASRPFAIAGKAFQDRTPSVSRKRIHVQIARPGLTANIEDAPPSCAAGSIPGSDRSGTRLPARLVFFTFGPVG